MFSVALRQQKVVYRWTSRIKKFFKPSLWSITVYSIQLTFQLSRRPFSQACHVTQMIYFQYNALICNKFVIWINGKHEITAILFASLAVSLLYLCILLLHLHIKKGKLQWEEDSFWTKQEERWKNEKWTSVQELSNLKKCPYSRGNSSVWAAACKGSTERGS